MSDTILREKTKIELKLPKKWAVIMHNDDFTPFDFVIEVLMHRFNKSLDEANAITMQIHKGSHAVVALYSKEVADEKVSEVTMLAERCGHPLRVTAREA